MRNPPRLLVDWFAWKALPWWQRLWLRVTGRSFWRTHPDPPQYDGEA